MKTGVIGLGAMGTGMAKNFLAAGTLHAVWNRTRSRSEAFGRENSVKVADTPAQLASECDLIITCVSRDEDVLQVIQQLLSGTRPGTVVVDTSTVNAETARQAAEMLSGVQAHFLDGPVSGGIEGANNGTLAMMAGGDSIVLDKVRDTLSAITSKVVHIGPAGSGQACKAVNQLMCAGVHQGVTEALAFGEAMGLDMQKVIDVVSRGAAGNWFLDHRGNSMLTGKFDPGFRIALHDKDLRICQSMARNLTEKNLPVLEMTLIHYQRLMQEGYGDEDVSALYRIKKNLFTDTGIEAPE